MKTTKIGVIGLGSIAENKHLPQIHESDNLELTAICDIDESKISVFAEKYGIDKAHCFTDYRDLVNCPDVEAVDICTPNFLHFEMGMAAVEANKPYSIEKPITMNREEADKLAEATKQSGVKNMVCFSYRFIPAVRYAKKLIEQGKIGRVYHINMEYAQGWGLPKANCKLVWRFNKTLTGSGTLGDLGSHGIDLVRFVTDKEYTKVCAMAGTYVTEREKLDGSGKGPVDVDDYCNCLAEMEDGISVTFHFTRFAPGRANYQRMEIYGSEGSIIYDIEKETLEVYGKNFAGQEEEAKYTEVAVPKEFEVIQMQSFGDVVCGSDDGLSATIFDGQKNQHIVDAMIESFESEKWVKFI